MKGLFPGVFTQNDTRGNYKLICKYFNLKVANLKTINQIHSNKVQIIHSINDDTSNIEADALITKSPNIILGILTADCAPILIQDPLKNIIAAVHIGWKGAYKGIINKVINPTGTPNKILSDVILFNSCIHFGIPILLYLDSHGFFLLK